MRIPQFASFCHSRQFLLSPSVPASYSPDYPFLPPWAAFMREAKDTFINLLQAMEASEATKAAGKERQEHAAAAWREGLPNNVFSKAKNC